MNRIKTHGKCGTEITIRIAVIVLLLASYASVASGSTVTYTWKFDKFAVGKNATGSAQESFALSMPDVIKLPDGSYRIYYGVSLSPPVSGATTAIKSAISTDGINWTVESGYRLFGDGDGDSGSDGIPANEGIINGARVVRMSSGTYRMYYQASTSGTSPPDFRVKSAISSDGINWTREGTRVNISYPNGGANQFSLAGHSYVIRFADNDYVILISGNYNGKTVMQPSDLVIGTSNDGLTFSNFSVLYTNGHDPFVVKLTSGSGYRLFYGNLLERQRTAFSTDGKSWASENQTTETVLLNSTGDEVTEESTEAPGDRAALELPSGEIILFMNWGSPSANIALMRQQSTSTPTPTISTIAISPSSFTLYPNETIQLSVVAGYSDNTTQDITNSAIWSFSGSSVTVSTGGLVKGVSPGTAAIKANYSGKEGSSTIIVTTKSFASNYSTIKNSTFGASAAPFNEGWTDFKDMGVHYMRLPINLQKGVVVDNIFLSQYDNYVKDGQTYGLIMYGIVNPTKDQNNQWSNSTEFANNLKNIVERYDGDGNSDMTGLQYPIKNWEINNEIQYGTKCENDPNCQWKGFTKDMYLDFMDKSRAALKDACADCSLLNGAQINPPSRQIQIEGYSSLKDLIDSKGTGIIDAISYHDYEENLDADQAVADFIGYGLQNKSIWVTETDMQNEWNKNNNLTQDDNAKLSVKSYIYSLYKGFDRLILASMRAALNDSAFVQWGSPLDPSTGSKRKVYYADKKLIEKVDYFTNVTTASLHNGTVFAFKFTVEGKPVYVLWATSNQTVNLNLSSSYVADVKITKSVPDDEIGTIATEYKTASNGSVNLNLTSTALYVEETSTASAGTPALVFAITPSSRNAQVGTPVTLLMSVQNYGSATATGVSIAQASSLPVTLSYQTWNLTALTGTPNTPVNISAGSTANFVVTISATSTFSSSSLTFNVSSTNGATAPISGVNTLTIAASAIPSADVIMMSTSLAVSTPVNTPTSFAVATSNVGTVAATGVSLILDIPSAITGLAYQVNQTNATTGAIIGPATGLTINAGAQPTFAVFLTPTQPIAYDPANNRITVKLVDGNGKVIGAQSIAVYTT